MGFVISEAQARPSVALSSCYLQMQIQNSQLSLQYYIFLHAAMFSAIITGD